MNRFVYIKWEGWDRDEYDIFDTSLDPEKENAFCTAYNLKDVQWLCTVLNERFL